MTKIKYTCHTCNSQPENNVPELKPECWYLLALPISYMTCCEKKEWQSRWQLWCHLLKEFIKWTGKWSVCWVTSQKCAMQLKLDIAVHKSQFYAADTGPTLYCSEHKLHFFVFCFYFWLHWVFGAAHGLSLVAASRGYSSLLWAGFSLQWLLLLWNTSSRCTGSVVVARGLSSCGSRDLECRLSSCGARA